MNPVQIIFNVIKAILSNKEFLCLILFVCVVLIILAFLKKRLLKNISKKKQEYYLKSNLLTPAELEFYRVLKELVGNQYSIQCKVRLEDIIGINEKLNNSAYATARNRIRAMHADFVLCNPETMEVLAVIELDDKSHRKLKSQENDAKKNEVLKEAGILLKRYPVKPSYDKNDIIDKLFEVEHKNDDSRFMPH